MMTTSSVAKYKADGLHYPGLLYTDVPQICPRPEPSHSNDAAPSEISEVANEKQYWSEKK